MLKLTLYKRISPSLLESLMLSIFMPKSQPFSYVEGESHIPYKWIDIKEMEQKAVPNRAPYAKKQ